MRDPYEVLGIPRSASGDIVKRRFRRLAKKLHPDADANDPKATARFSELVSAYTILRDEITRKRFDEGAINADGKQRDDLSFSRRAAHSVVAAAMLAAMLLVHQSSVVGHAMLHLLQSEGHIDRTSEPRRAEETMTDRRTDKIRATRLSEPTTIAGARSDRRQIELLIGRSEKLISEGDVPAGRLLLQRAAEARDPRAALALGATYDPIMLAELQAYGVVADVSLARDWYRKASELGSQEAQHRLDLLAALTP